MPLRVLPCMLGPVDTSDPRIDRSAPSIKHHACSQSIDWRYPELSAALRAGGLVAIHAGFGKAAVVFARGMQAVADKGDMPHEGGC